ncbi:MAG: beta-propeller domain-containing protein, partial [Deltaproteobacteria bacterium]|nr:beta-propeller domain-containing protein [Deltaproteobacteria bacterium]
MRTILTSMTSRLLGFTVLTILWTGCQSGPEKASSHPGTGGLPGTDLPDAGGAFDGGGAAGDDGGGVGPDGGGEAGPPIVGDFIVEEPGPTNTAGRSAGSGGSSASPSPSPSAGAGGAPAASDTTGLPLPAPGAPGGRVAEVEEADIYRLSGNNLLYFNTYRGFLIYDLTDPKQPQQIGRLPVFGYPTEMFVSGTTVYALIRDALYLTQVDGQLQFQRYNTSQMVAIDISDPRQPKVIKTMDIVGQLREGVSRKIDNSIYVVSYVRAGYQYSTWSLSNTAATKEQAWVYSFDVSNPQAPRKVDELQIFEGGSVSFSDNGTNYSKYFSGVSISATSNALMVVENWYVYTSGGGTPVGGTAPVGGGPASRCGSFESNQRAVVSLIDVSDPKGTIRRHTRFETNGVVTDQFKLTYVFDAIAKTGTFFGIFAAQVWSGAGCAGTFATHNVLESWNVTDGANPKRLGRLTFGKPNETVRGTAYDVSRNVVYAITAQRIDPLYAISIADPVNLKVLSAIDGLSGDISVFRLVGDRKFLLTVGQDTSGTCTGFDSGTGWQNTKVAVSVIDVRELNAVHLVQRQCVAIDNALWSGSAVTSNLDQAHKLIGMFSDEEVNVITVPVYYVTKSDTTDWWWYRSQTAVGIMAWDLTKYDATKDEKNQTVIKNYGTFTHPNGEVRRTIVFRHPKTGRRTMLNLSDTHASIADLQDLARPQQLSTLEIAPYFSRIYRFGDYLVEDAQSQAYGATAAHEFRVRRAATAGTVGDAPVATFALGQVESVLKQGKNLLMFRRNSAVGSTSVLVYDLTDPTKPRRAGAVDVPFSTLPSYLFWCGWSPWAGYWFGDAARTFTPTARGVVMLNTRWMFAGSQYEYRTDLVAVDTSNADAPQVSTQLLPGSTATTYQAAAVTLVPDALDLESFYLTSRQLVGTTTHADGTSWTQYRHLASRWRFTAAGVTAAETVNLPGTLVHTWASATGERAYLTHDNAYTQSTFPGSASFYYQSTTRMHLLRAHPQANPPAARLIDSWALTDQYPSGLV